MATSLHRHLTPIAVVALAAALLAACSGGGSSKSAATSTTSSATSHVAVERVTGGPTGTYLVPPGIHEIKHVIVIMQENRSFDSYFGTFPGADGIPMKDGKPSVCVDDPQTKQCVAPYVDHADVNGGGPHNYANETSDVDGGKMDGFIGQAEAARKGCADPTDPACDGCPEESARQTRKEVSGFLREPLGALWSSPVGSVLPLRQNGLTPRNLLG